MRQLAFLGHSLIRLEDVLDPVLMIAPLERQQSRDLVGAAECVSLKLVGHEFDQFAKLEFVVWHVSSPAEYWMFQRGFLPGLPFGAAAPGALANGDACATGAGLVDFGLRFSRLLVC